MKECIFPIDNYFAGEVRVKESCLVGWTVAYNYKFNWNSLVLHDINISRQYFCEVN